MFTYTPNPTRPPRPRPTAEQASINPWLLWRPEEPVEAETLSVAEMAECRCPDLCDRDHANE